MSSEPDVERIPQQMQRLGERLVDLSCGLRPLPAGRNAVRQRAERPGFMSEETPRSRAPRLTR
jgi:hypothetical protein